MLISRWALTIVSLLMVFSRSGLPLVVAQDQAITLGSTIEGVVLGQDGKPLPDAKVWALPEQDMRYPITTTSDAAGTFTLRSIPPGGVYVLAFNESEGYPYPFYAFYRTKNDRTSVKVEAKPGAVTSGVILQLGPKAAYLKVDATDEKGVPVQVGYQLDRDDTPGPYSTSVPSDPRLVGVGFIKGVMLVPPVPFRLTVVANGYEPWHYGGANYAGKDGLITLKSGQTLTLTVRLSKK
jgi:hypothetical protein